MTDLAGENLHRKPADPGAMKSLSELMHLIALGRKIAVLPRVLTRPLRDDLITVPMADLPPVALLLAWPAHSTSLPAVSNSDTATHYSPAEYSSATMRAAHLGYAPDRRVLRLTGRVCGYSADHPDVRFHRRPAGQRRDSRRQLDSLPMVPRWLAGV
jgi:hypothetical protein